MDFLPTFSIVFTVVGLITEYLIIHFKIINGIMNRLTKLETQIAPFWKLIECEIPKLIHSPHTPEIDILLDKFSNGGISYDEARCLKSKLQEEMSIPDTGRKLAIVLFMMKLDQITNDYE